jgi:hypothetical protein
MHHHLPCANSLVLLHCIQVAVDEQWVQDLHVPDSVGVVGIAGALLLFAVQGYSGEKFLPNEVPKQNNRG